MSTPMEGAVGFRDQVMDRIRQAKEEEGSYRKLAAKAGVNYGTLYKWVTGKRKTALDDIGAVMDYLGVSICDTKAEQIVPDADTEKDAELIRLRAQVDVLERVVGISKEKEKNVG